MSFDQNFKERMRFFTMKGENLGSLEIVGDLSTLIIAALFAFQILVSLIF